VKFLAATALAVCTAALLLVPLSAHAQAPAPLLALPPLEYDYPYQGQLTIARTDAKTMREVCPETSFPVTLGCAIRRVGNTVTSTSQKTKS
jgi:hypothetical protein